ncbi:MAG: AAA family ATPase [Proteobacteria bacterium]|nr:AAA family ATPase [Pseudomonadota bacterium]
MDSQEPGAVPGAAALPNAAALQNSVTLQNPLHLLAHSMLGWPGPGRLGVVMARAGEGKTACLVQISLSHLLRGQTVLHVSLEHSLDHVQSWYDALFEHVAGDEEERRLEATQAMITHRRMILTFIERRLRPEKLAESLAALRKTTGFAPEVLIIDGYDFDGLTVDEQRAVIDGFTAQAGALGAELWMAVQTHREHTGQHPVRIPPPADAWSERIEVALFLEPHEGDIAVRLLKRHSESSPADTALRLQPRTHRLVTQELKIVGDGLSAQTTASGVTLLSGGAAGTESEFGACAERWGLGELNFTFAGRTPTRTRNLVWLSEQELAQGAVSPVYLQAHMHRSYPDSEQLRRTLQSIWHQVNTAGEVFAVGLIQPDQTVKGGTGWAVELGRLWKKAVHVYDQERRGWYTWQGAGWVAEAPPMIRARRWCGTGTRSLADHGRAAVRELFERSFGPAPRD